jgi:hypothetical protein
VSSRVRGLQGATTHRQSFCLARSCVLFNVGLPSNQLGNWRVSMKAGRSDQKECAIVRTYFLAPDEVLAKESNI